MKIHLLLPSLALAFAGSALAQQNDTVFFSKNTQAVKSIVSTKGDHRHTRLYYESGLLQQEYDELAVTAAESKSPKKGKEPGWLLHGNWKSWYSSGKLSKECAYDHGLFTGTSKTYFENGSLSEVKGYKTMEIDGKLVSVLHGPELKYGADGRKQREGNYKDNKKNGKETEWYTGGNKRRETTFKNGYKMGFSTYWFESGKQASAGSYDTMMVGNRNGTPYPSEVQDGHWTTWYQNGNKQSDGAYLKGKHHGHFTEWYENGTKKSEVDYAEGTPNGGIKRWFQNGQLQIAQTRLSRRDKKTGELSYTDEGRYEEYNEAGKPLRTGTYKNGKKTGKWLQYSSDVIVDEADYTNGQLIGLHTQRYPGNYLMRTETYKAFTIGGRDTTLLDGEQLSYSEKGKLHFQVTYSQGQQVAVTQKLYHENGAPQSMIVDEGDRYLKIDYYPNRQKQKESFATKNVNKPFDKLNFVTAALYDTLGRVRRQVSFNNDFPQGYVGRWNEDGVLTGEGYIFNDPEEYASIGYLKNGLNVEYYNNGQPRREVYIVNYFLGGYETEWYVTGELKRVQQFGIYDLQWLQNGQLMDASFYDPKNQNIRLDSVADKRWVQEIYNRYSRSANKVITLATASDGIVHSYYDDLQVRFEGRVVNHRFDDFFKGYFDNGKPMVEWQLKQGIPNGRYMLMNPNGTLRESGYFSNGKPSGYWKVNYTTGRPNYECLYDSSDAKGKQVIFRKEFSLETGKLHKLENYKNGQYEGLQQTWSDQGVLMQQYTVKNGKTVGDFSYWWGNGNPQRESHYNEDGQQDGLEKTWYENGWKEREMGYTKGKQDGSFRSWWKNGKLWAVGRFVMGEKDSTWVTYDSLGVLKSEFQFVNGKAQLPSSTDPCNCTEEERKIGFAPWLADLADSAKFQRWQFPFHEKLSVDLKSLFYADFQSSYSGDMQFNSFTLLAYKPIEIKFPDSKGLTLVLNPCYKFSGSRIPVSGNTSSRDPKQTYLQIQPHLLAFKFDPKFLTPIDPAVPATQATFSVSLLTYEAKGVKLSDPTSQCFNTSRICNGHVMLSLNSFVPVISSRAYLPSEPSWRLTIETNHFTGIHQGSGQLSCEFSPGVVIELPVQQLALNNQLLAAVVSVAASKNTEGTYTLKTKGKGVTLSEAALTDYLNKEGFRVGNMSFESTTNLLSFNLIYTK